MMIYLAGNLFKHQCQGCRVPIFEGINEIVNPLVVRF